MSPLSPRPASRGFVLPVVLVVLVVMTTVVLFNIRRGAVDERLATNVRQFVTMETAATYALRYCEIMLTVSPPGRAALPGLPDPPNVVAAPPNNGPPAWRQWANWKITPAGLPNPLHQTVVLAPDLLGLEVQRAECLFEDATSELVVLNTTPNVANNATDVPPNWQKYRITAEVQGVGVARAQSELRISLN